MSIGRAGQVYAKPTIDPLRGSGFAGRFAIEWHWFQVKLKPDRDHRKTAKIGEILPDPVRILSNPMIFPPNRAENRQIWCIYDGSDCFGRRNLPNQAENLSESWRIRQNLMSLGRSGFTGFEGRDLKPTHMRWVLELRTRVR